MSSEQPVRLRFIACVAFAIGMAPLPARAQIASRLDLGSTLQVGGEAERYLRVLQLTGAIPLASWTIQPFTAPQAARLTTSSAHPWAERFTTSSAAPSLGTFSVLRPEARVIGNSAFPFQPGNGPTWAGRGLTAEVQAGISATLGPVHLQIAPVAFIAQNAAFTLVPNGLTGDGQFRDARFSGGIDLPQRFGDASYHRVDFGNSMLDVDLPGITVGVSNEPQRWGPAREYPLVLGPNGGGFPHAHIGTRNPVDLWLFRLNARLIFGQMRHSAFIDASDATSQFASAVVFSILPRGIPGLEFGATRFVEGPWPNGGLRIRQILRPFSGLVTLGDSGSNSSTENQVASGFFRWAVPQAGAEFYGEMYREDYTGNFRWFLQKPDDLVDFMLGFQRVLSSSATHIRVLRGEIVNGETSQQERGQRGLTQPTPPYTHGAGLGHTVYGLLLGSPEAYGGAGWRIGVDDYTQNGRRSISLERSLRFDWLPARADSAMVHPDVIYGVRFDLVRFRGAREYGITVIPMIDLNRDLRAYHDVFSLSTALTFRGWP